jgi:protein-disulfide isomerase
MVVHDHAMKGHVASCAASKQGKFNEFRHEWWEKAWPAYAESKGDQSKLGDEMIDAIAGDLHLDMSKFHGDEASPECQARVRGDMQELTKFAVNSTPSFFINGQKFGWDGNPDSFKAAIDEKLAMVEKSGVSCSDYYDKEVIGKGLKQVPRSARQQR